MADEIDLFASLRDVSRKGTAGKKFALDIRAPKLIFNPNDKEISKTVAAAIAQQLKENLLDGKAPDGSPMPGIDPDTETNRSNLEERGRRGGDADPRFVDDAFRAKAKRNYDRQYTGRRGALKGKTFTPKAGGPRGVVSGMTAESFFVRPMRDGKGFLVFVAGARSAALERIFRGIPIWSQGAMSQPRIRDAMKAAAQRILPIGLRGVLTESAKLLSNLRDLISEVDEISEDE